MTRVEIDLNVRVRGNWTFSGLEDADGPLEVGEIVEVYEPETGFAGPGRVEEVDEARRVVFLSIDWGSLRAPQPTLAARLGAIVTFTKSQGVAASHFRPTHPTPVRAATSIPCRA